MIAVICEAENGFHIRLVSRGRWELPELKRQAVASPNLAPTRRAYRRRRERTVAHPGAKDRDTVADPSGSAARRQSQPRARGLAAGRKRARMLSSEGAWLNDFIDELTSFPVAPHDDQVDALTQALNWMRGSYFDSADWQRTERMQAEYFARRRRGAPAYGSMVNNVNDMLAFEDGQCEVPGRRFTNPSRFSRIRGAW